LPVTNLDLAIHRGAKEDGGRISMGEVEDTGVPFMGGCSVCGATIACYNSCPSKSGYIKCLNGCIGDDGWEDVVEANEAIFGEME